MTDRGLSTPVGTVALIAVTVTLALVVGSTVAGSIGSQGSVQARFDLTVNPASDRIAIEHRGGGTIDVRDLSMTVSVNGRPLDRQPPVPFFAAEGFVSGPTGPFNSATDPTWTAGERGSIAIADTNDPTIEAGDAVEVRLVVDGQVVAELSTTADGTAGDVAGEREPVHSGARAAVMMAVGVTRRFESSRCSTSSNPAVANIRSASSAS